MKQGNPEFAVELLQRASGPLTVAVIEDNPDHALLASEAAASARSSSW
jgi:hypothetical protein